MLLEEWERERVLRTCEKSRSPTRYSGGIWKVIRLTKVGSDTT